MTIAYSQKGAAIDSCERVYIQMKETANTKKHNAYSRTHNC